MSKQKGEHALHCSSTPVDMEAGRRRGRRSLSISPSWMDCSSDDEDMRSQSGISVLDNHTGGGHQGSPCQQSSAWSVATSTTYPTSVESYTSKGSGITALEYYRVLGVSVSPRTFHQLEAAISMLSSPSVRISLALLAYFGLPVLFFRTVFFASSLSDYAVTLWTFWDGIFSISSIAVAFCVLCGAFVYAEWAALRDSSDGYLSYTPPASILQSLASVSPSFGGVTFSFDGYSNNNVRQFSDGFYDQSAHLISSSSSDSADCDDSECASDRCIITATAACLHRYVQARSGRMFHVIFHLNLWFFLIMLGVVGPNSLVWPSWYWHPFLFGRYSVYSPFSLAPALQNVVLNSDSLNALTLHGGSRSNHKPLNMTAKEWDTLSTGALSPDNVDDLFFVGKGIRYARERSGGIVVTVLARNVVDYIDPLQLNVESLVPFFSNVAVVIFENDSDDGSREKFKAWAEQAHGYRVDLMECEGVVDCHLKKKHRDDVVPASFDKSSAIGDMHKFRQQVVKYITSSPTYDDYSHMMVLDVDLGVSFSPLGILHSLGSKPWNPIASSGRQPFPTSFGTLTTPYDINAFRPVETRENIGLQAFHKAFCGIESKGDRWRNECEALCPTKLIQIMLADRLGSNGDLYRVESAFNGAVLYPLSVVRTSHAKYDAGDDGQRCEHIGFNLSLKKEMFVNKKWAMNLSPQNPGGEAGKRAKQTADRITFNPILAATVFTLHLVPLAVFILAFMTLGVYVLHPIVLRLVSPVATAWSKIAYSPPAKTRSRRKPFGGAFPETPHKGARYDI